MSNLLILSCAILSFNCKTKVQHSLNDDDLKKVEIRFVNLVITTPIHVKCNAFEDFFDEEKIQNRTFTNSKEWNELLEQINDLASTGEESNEIPDVRMTIKLHYADNIRLICVGNIVSSINGTTYVNNSIFRSFIEANFHE